MSLLILVGLIAGASTETLLKANCSYRGVYVTRLTVVDNNGRSHECTKAYTDRDLCLEVTPRNQSIEEREAALRRQQAFEEERSRLFSEAWRRAMSMQSGDPECYTPEERASIDRIQQQEAARAERERLRAEEARRVEMERLAQERAERERAAQRQAAFEAARARAKQQLEAAAAQRAQAFANQLRETEERMRETHMRNQATEKANYESACAKAGKVCPPFPAKKPREKCNPIPIPGKFPPSVCPA